MVFVEVEVDCNMDDIGDFIKFDFIILGKFVYDIFGVKNIFEIFFFVV